LNKLLKNVEGIPTFAGESSFIYYLTNSEGPRSRTGVKRELCANHKLSRNCM
jgi:hypothetical protein